MADDHYTHSFAASVTMPDGRNCLGIVYGVLYPAPVGFQLAERDAVRIQEANGKELDDDEYQELLTLGGKQLTVETFVIAKVSEHFERVGWEPVGTVPTNG